jgi:predicted nicotinamide N-methyase
MDFFSRLGLQSGSRVMDIGCGWGLAGIYCAKRHDAVVTGVDVDPEVFPYLRLHARINRVRIKTLNTSFERVPPKDLESTDILIGADICFWDAMVVPLEHFICRALTQGVHTVVIADPGRSSFHELARFFKEQEMGEVLSWCSDRPSPIEGKILRISSSIG